MKQKILIGASSGLALLLAIVVVLLVSGAGDPKTRFQAFTGNAEAQMALSREAFLGTGGKVDEESGAYWATRAAKNGHVPAQGLMGVLYMGGIGVDQDLGEAKEWLSQSKDSSAKELAAMLDMLEKNIEQLPEGEREKIKEVSYKAASNEVRKSFSRIISDMSKQKGD